MLRLFGVGFSMSLRRSLAHRTNLTFDILLALLTLGSELAVVQLIYSQTDSLAGWSRPELLVLVGTFQLMAGIRAAFIEPNLIWFIDQVRDGKMDLYLVQPAPSLFLASLSTHSPVSLTRVGLGATVIGVGIADFGQLPTIGGVLIWLLLLAVGVAIMWALGVLVSCFAFWAPRLQLDVLFGSALNLARYPVDIYSRPLRFVLTYLFPMAVITTLPTTALLRGPELTGVLASVAAGAGIALLAIGAWSVGVRRYTGATS
jgi:ABC-2 type transport system permease protein